MLDFITQELGGRGIATAVAFFLGGLSSWLVGRWRRMRDRRCILRGDARDTVVIEHGSDGARILTLMEMARRYRAEQTHIAQLRREGKRTQYVETMYNLDLALDCRTSPTPVKPVPWGRFESVLKAMGLE